MIGLRWNKHKELEYRLSRKHKFEGFVLGWQWSMHKYSCYIGQTSFVLGGKSSQLLNWEQARGHIILQDLHAMDINPGSLLLSIMLFYDEFPLPNRKCIWFSCLWVSDSCRTVAPWALGKDWDKPLVCGLYKSFFFWRAYSSAAIP